MLELISKKKGAPMKPSYDLDVYVFALFNKKPGPTFERNYGLFKLDGTPTYKIAIADGGGSQVSYGGIQHSSGPTTNTWKGIESTFDGFSNPDSPSPTLDLSFLSRQEL